jgi:hypothetical protein
VTAEYYVFALGCLKNVYDIGHSDYSCIFVQNGAIVELKILAATEGLVNWISFQHEG